MAVGREVRVPFCDHRLVEYVFSKPIARSGNVTDSNASAGLPVGKRVRRRVRPLEQSQNSARIGSQPSGTSR